MIAHFIQQQYILSSNEYMQAIQEGSESMIMHMIFPIIIQAANKSVRNSNLIKCFKPL